MPEPKQRITPRDATLLVGLCILLLFSSPLVAWWASPTHAWYLPYLVWFVIILLIVWAQYHQHEP